MILSTFTECGPRPTVSWELECYELFEAGGAHDISEGGLDVIDNLRGQLLLTIWMQGCCELFERGTVHSAVL